MMDVPKLGDELSNIAVDIPEFREEDTIERWLELKESGMPFLEVGNIAGKVRGLLDEARTLKGNYDRLKKLAGRL